MYESHTHVYGRVFFFNDATLFVLSYFISFDWDINFGKLTNRAYNYYSWGIKTSTYFLLTSINLPFFNHLFVLYVLECSIGC